MLLIRTVLFLTTLSISAIIISQPVTEGIIIKNFNKVDNFYALGFSFDRDARKTDNNFMYLELDNGLGDGADSYLKLVVTNLITDKIVFEQSLETSNIEDVLNSQTSVHKRVLSLMKEYKIDHYNSNSEVKDFPIKYGGDLLILSFTNTMESGNLFDVDLLSRLYGKKKISTQKFDGIGRAKSVYIGNYSNRSSIRAYYIRSPYSFRSAIVITYEGKLKAVLGAHMRVGFTMQHWNKPEIEVDTVDGYKILGFRQTIFQGEGAGVTQVMHNDSSLAILDFFMPVGAHFSKNLVLLREAIGDDDIRFSIVKIDKLKIDEDTYDSYIKISQQIGPRAMKEYRWKDDSIIFVNYFSGETEEVFFKDLEYRNY